MRNFIRLYLIAIAQILLLCSCNMTTPPDRSGSLSKNKNPGLAISDSRKKPATNPAINTATNTVIIEHHEITSTQSMEKDGLLVSYNLQAIPSKDGFLIRLSLVFRNLQDRSRVVKPKVSLMDASGKMISAYTKKGFIKSSSRLAGKASENVSKSNIKNDRDEKRFAKSRAELANTNWLKPSYKMPSKGIAIGELIYHSTHLNLPMKLTVNSNKQEFVFTTRDKLPGGQ